MWDFSFGKSVGMILRTLPFVVLRLIVYVGIAIEGQAPDAEWEARLSSASSKFRELAQKAAGWVPKPAAIPAPPPPPTPSPAT